MKYIIKNIHKFVKDDTLVFVLMIFTVVISSLMLHFSYAVYQNYEIEKESALKDDDYIYVMFNYEIEHIDINHPASQYMLMDYDGDAITKEMMTECLSDIDEAVLSEVTSILTQVSYCNYPFNLSFLYQDGKYKICEETVTNGGIASGRYFTQEDYDTGAKVALIFDYEHANASIGSPITEGMLYDDTHIKIGDELYEIIGTQICSLDIPLLPVTVFPDDAIIVNAIKFEFNDSVSLYQYNQVCDAVEEHFGNLATVLPVDLPDIDTIRLYNTIIVISVIISVIAALNFAILFRYILNKRRKQISCMRLCGLKYGKTVLLYMGECMILTIIPFIISAFSFAKWILPWISSFYKYGFDTYNKMVYVILFGIYFAIAFVVMLFMVMTNISKKRVISEG